jgi:hypothetical protein
MRKGMESPEVAAVKAAVRCWVSRGLSRELEYIEKCWNYRNSSTQGPKYQRHRH